MITLRKIHKSIGHKIYKVCIAGLVVAMPLALSGSPHVSKAAGMNPDPVPDYYTTPNYANSPLPEVDANKNVIQGTGIRKFVDSLPGLGEANKNNLGQYIPVAIPDTTTYPGSDYYEISLVQYTEKLHSDLPATTLRGYVQTNTTDPSVQKPNYFGPTIIAQKDRPVRIKFTNKLGTGKDGDLFLPVDTSIMGAGMGPDGKTMYTQNRANLHLHGGITPWISDGTPHQWITPAGENTPYPKGVSVQNVPDMPDPGDGSMTFYYTNQQSARLMFFHDHSYGITRLNVYAGEAGGYLLRDQVEQDLIKQGVIPQDEIPLLIQDKSFVPNDTQLMATDPTWDKTKWGGTGNLWFPHVYMPNQNPYDMSGANPFGRWDYGPWFWPPNTGLKQGPVPNPLAGQPGQGAMNPGVPNVTAVPEAFMDTPVVNGTAYPYVDVQPKAYRFRILNASNDRTWNLQLYKAKSNASMWNASGTLNDADAGEVNMVPAVRTAGYPATWPTDGRDGGVPDPAAAGPKMMQIGTDSGFLKSPVELANQPIDYEYNRRSVTVLNVSSKTLLLAPAERADVVVDFSQYAGQTLILYNDGPAPIPAFDPRYDYYTGDPDQTSSGGAPTTLPGYGPNTRTVMQIRVAANPSGTTAGTAASNLKYPLGSTEFKTAMETAFNNGQNKLPVPDGTWGNIQDTSLTFTPNGSTSSITMPMQPKAIAEAFEANYGRMNAVLGTELPNTNFTNQTTVMLGYIDPATENFKDTATPLSTVANDGTQIWKITHNGVDTHAIHFHLFDIQLVNRVGWDGSIRMPDANEKGWKDTLRMNPLEDVIIIMKPTAPKVPFGLPDSIRPLDPTMPVGSTFSSLDPLTGAASTVTNKLTNFGWEYVWHCHLLGHEENDMMRPMTLTVDRSLPAASVLSGTRPANSPAVLNWTDPTPASGAPLGNPANEIGYKIQRAPIDAAGKIGVYTQIGTALANATSYTDTTANANTSYSYQVIAFNAAGETASNALTLAGLPAAPANLTAAASGTSANLTWTDQATNETGFVVERSADGTNFTVVNSAVPPVTGSSASYTDTGLAPGTYTYRVKAVNAVGSSAYSNTAAVTITATPAVPAAPANLQATLQMGPTVALTWADQAVNETGFTVERSANNGVSFTAIGNANAVTGTGTGSYNDTNVNAGQTYLYRVKAVNATGSSTYSNTVRVPLPSAPAAPSNTQLSISNRGTLTDTLMFQWRKPSGTVSGYIVQYATNAAFTQNVVTAPPIGAAATSYSVNVAKGNTYYFRVRAVNGFVVSPWSAVRFITAR
ncbi:fibronectin type III domain-containing protein [Ectobacillus ponti]|uniref:Fibronectin type III domain-containing protein n=1 Tax=Ectobacillus ponti TaxID=2961894 RepID=A0AA41X7F8_9BACI|nr:fibronectin type III domain-containing protein [Ectobacillus ponti]MCP8968583.1 fibronectin type III domain-containing protein [Ectobacillus ponti]